MAAALIYDLSPMKLGTTVLAIDDLRFSPDVVAEPFIHSGNEFASVMRVSGGNPAVSFKTPFAEAFALIGLKVLKLTAWEGYLAKFVDAIRQSGAVHRKYSLNTSAVAMAYITGASVTQDGWLAANVTVVFLSSDGVAAPLVPSDTGTLPTLASEPVLYGCGPVAINGTTYGGVSGWDLDLGSRVQIQRTDGDVYPRVCAFLGGAPVISVDSADAASMWGVLFPLGVTASANLVVYARKYDATTQVIGTASGLSLTIASGRVIPSDIDASTGKVASTKLRMLGLSTTSTHPVAVATGVTVPTP